MADRVAKCACGGLSITVKNEPSVVSACNCLECQRRTGSVFGVAAFYPQEQLVSVSGVAKDFNRKGQSGRSVHMHFCPSCGTTVYWHLDLYPNLIGVAVGCFADPNFAPLKRSVWTSKKHHWVEFPNKIEQFPEGP